AAGSGGASAGSGKTASPESASYAAAPTSELRYAIVREKGSTPDFASRIRATIVGLPAATRIVRMRATGGFRSFCHERSRYRPGSGASVKGSLRESTAT